MAIRSSHHATAAHADRVLRDAQAAFRAWRGDEAYEVRARQIAALPVVVFKGRALRTLRCHGVRGNGPHDCHVPEVVLWVLIDLQGWCCVWHQGDQLGAGPPQSEVR